MPVRVPAFLQRPVMAGENAARLRCIIDADNAQPTVVEGLLAEVAKYGTA
jgi:hypothetical protein